MSLELDKQFPFKQVIVVGGTGQTGRRLLEQLAATLGTRVVGTSRATLDLEAAPENMALQLRAIDAQLEAGVPTALIMAAAFTNVEGCETDPARSRLINESRTFAVFEWALRRYAARIVFYSSDYVFDGKSGPYRETDQRRPLSEYGRAKARVEDWLAARAPDALVVRTTGVYDYLPGARNFLMQLLERFGRAQRARVPADQVANPVWAPELATATLELLARGARGTWHVAGGQQLARVEFGRAIARAFGFDPKLVEPVTTDELGQKAARPLVGGLDCSKLVAELGWAPMPPAPVLEALKAFHKAQV